MWERRAAIDIGSGGTKVAIADVDTETNQIVQILIDTYFAVPYQDSLDKSLDGTFDQETKAMDDFFSTVFVLLQRKAMSLHEVDYENL